MSNTFYNPKAQYNFLLSSDSVENRSGDFLESFFDTIQLPASFPKDQLFELQISDFSVISSSNTGRVLSTQIKIGESDLTEYYSGSQTSSDYVTFSCTVDRAVADVRSDRIPNSKFLFFLDGTNKLTFSLRFAETYDNVKTTNIYLNFSWTLAFYIRPVYN